MRKQIISETKTKIILVFVAFIFCPSIFIDSDFFILLYLDLWVLDFFIMAPKRKANYLQKSVKLVKKEDDLMNTDEPDEKEIDAQKKLTQVRLALVIGL